MLLYPLGCLWILFLKLSRMSKISEVFIGIEYFLKTKASCLKMKLMYAIIIERSNLRIQNEKTWKLWKKIEDKYQKRIKVIWNSVLPNIVNFVNRLLKCFICWLFPYNLVGNKNPLTLFLTLILMFLWSEVDDEENFIGFFFICILIGGSFTIANNNFKVLKTF